MPGLFGILTLDPRSPLSPDRAAQSLHCMAAKLRHQDDYDQDSWIDPDGQMAVGRIGHSTLLPRLGSASSSEPTGLKTWYYGQPFSETPPDQGKNEEGLTFLARLGGSFSALCVDRPRDRILLFADRRASEPIYFVQDGSFLAFAPEVKALLALGLDPGELDPASLASFMTAGYLKPHQSLFTRIRKVPSCHGLVIENGTCQLEEYWRYHPGHLSRGESETELAAELHPLVKSSVQNNFGKPEESMVFLSGGLDSRYILAALCEKSGVSAESVSAVTWGESRGVAGSDPEIAEEVIKLLRVKHRFLARRSDQYGAWFKEANYLVDGLSEIAAFHPHEYQIMKALRSEGFRQVIRGDEAFGYLGRRYSAESALVTVQIRPLDAVDHFSRLIRPEWYNRARVASREDYSDLQDRFKGLDFTVMKDVAYFTQRVPTYLSQAGYYKQILFDQRNPLMSNELLDFYQKIPNSLRDNKKLFFRSFSQAYPDLAAIPYAWAESLEDWGALLTRDTPIRRFMADEFSDEKSGIWDVFDRAAVLSTFDSLASSSVGPRQSSRHALKAKVRQVAGRVFPKQLDHARAQRSLARVPVTKTLLRIMVLKDWHDRFVSSRG